MVHELGALEHVLAVGCRVDEVVLGKVMPHEPVLVAPETNQPFTRTDQHANTQKLPRNEKSTSNLALPLAGPRVHRGHALAAHRVEVVDDICKPPKTQAPLNENRWG